MIDLKHILALLPAERDNEIRKLIVPKPWKHDWKIKWPGDPPTGTYFDCSKCSAGDYLPELNASKPEPADPCPIPDRIELDWNLAMRMRDECSDNCKWMQVIIEIYTDSPHRGSLIAWLISEVQPHHYILAALIAKENK